MVLLQANYSFTDMWIQCDTKKSSREVQLLRHSFEDFYHKAIICHSTVVIAMNLHHRIILE